MDILHHRLREFVPLIRVKASCISILEKPEQFYNSIISKISTSTNQIVLSSLYIGNDALSLKMVKISQQ